MKINSKLLLVSRIIVGLTFIFSGFVKAVDPSGWMIKLTEYFIAFNIEGLQPAAVVLTFILCCYEVPLGVGILFGLRGKLMSWLLLLTMLPFTILTFYLAISNPVSDCGCFGDAIILTNWETFYKNVVLMGFTIIIFISRKNIKPIFKGFWDWGLVIISTLLIVVMSVYCYAYLPILDFRAYKVGNDVKELMTIPEGKTGDILKTVLVYTDLTTGELKEFDASNLPMDENLEYLETKPNELVKKGYDPPTKSFKLDDSTGVEVTDLFLNENGYRLLIVHHKLESEGSKAQKKLNELVNNILKDGDVGVWAVTSALNEDVKTYINKYEVPYFMHSADIVLLETIIRSNPGLLLFKDNVIIKKWPSKKIPSYEKLNSLLYN